MTVDRAQVVTTFVSAGDVLADLVAQIGAEQWDGPGLGEWTVRELVGHGSRAFTTTVEYLVAEPPSGAGAGRPSDDDPVSAAGAYFAATVGDPDLSGQVAERGKKEGLALGQDPVAAVCGRVAAARAALASAPAGAVFATRFGVVGFTTYLCTRVVEAAVHTLDIAGACGRTVELPADAERLALAVLAESARHRGAGPAVVLALGGRDALPATFSLFG